jgi:hypothetical protein
MRNAGCLAGGIRGAGRAREGLPGVRARRDSDVNVQSLLKQQPQRFDHVVLGGRRPRPMMRAGRM